MNFILLPILLIPFTINSSSNSKFISSWGELKQAIITANDGDVLYVNDIDFESNTDGLYSEFERITINKSITLIGKDDQSIFHHGSFALKASGSYNEQLKVSFQNIKFLQYDGDNIEIPLSDWDVDESASLEVPVKCQYVASFEGNIEANYSNCTFSGYMHIDGAVFQADYSNSENSKLYLNIDNCHFNNNAAYHSGGVFTLKGKSNNIDLNVCNSLFENNISGINGSSGYGGGVLYADQINANVVGSKFINNVANHKYLGATVTSDSTSGGAIYLTNSTFNIDGTAFLNNRASLGGAIRANNTNSFIKNSSFNQNNSESVIDTGDDKGKYSNKEMGGAFYQTGFGGYKTTFFNCEIIHNRSKNVYGGIHVYKPLSDSLVANELELINCLYYDNTSLTEEFIYDGDEEEDIFKYSSYSISYSAIIDETFKRYYPSYALPEKANKYCYYSSIEEAINDGIIKNDSYDYNSDILIVPIEEIMDTNVVIYGQPFVGNCYAKNIVITLNNRGEKQTITFANNTIINLDKANDTFFKNFKCWKNENTNSQFNNEKTHIAFKGYENITLVAQYTYNNNFYFLVIGVPIIVVFITLITFLTIYLIKNFLKNKKMCKANFTKEEINQILSMPFDITKKEKEVLTMMLYGKTRNEIAKSLFVSEATVKTHINHIYQKFGVEGKRQAFNKKMHTLLEKNQ